MKKSNVLFLIIFGISLLFFNETISAQEWNQIIPLVSKCDDVKKILKVNECTFPFSTYQFSKFKISIDFSTDTDRWAVSNDTVIKVYVGLKEFMKLEDYVKDLSDFEIVPEDDLPDVKIYTNEKKGIELTVQYVLPEEPYISDILIFPPKKVKKKGCTEIKKQLAMDITRIPAILILEKLFEKLAIL